jgi:hypothetical protein
MMIFFISINHINDQTRIKVRHDMKIMEFFKLIL